MKISVAYSHDPADFSPIFLAIVSPSEPIREESWLPAYRDTVVISGTSIPVVWVKTEYPDGYDIWIKDKAGARKAIKI
jgi:hypothetical protein